MEKVPVFIKINSNKNRFLFIAIFSGMPRYFPRHILKEAAESTHTFKAQNHRYFFDAMRGMQQQPFRFGHHSFLYNLQREGIPYAANKLESVLGERCNKAAYACTCFFSLK